jgi:hypothetical protein
MANVFLAAVLLSGILVVSGCGMPLPGSGAYGYGGGYGGGYSGGVVPYYGGGQAYPQVIPVEPPVVYAPQAQPYYQSQPYAYSGAAEPYIDPQSQSGSQVTQGSIATPSGQWSRRQLHQQQRIQQGLASGQLTPEEARRLQHQQNRIQGAATQMGANGTLTPQQQHRLNTMQQNAGQNIYRMRHNGVQAGTTAPTGTTGTVQPASPMRQGMQPRMAAPPGVGAQPRMAAQPRAAAPQRAAAQPRASSNRSGRPTTP